MDVSRFGPTAYFMALSKLLADPKQFFTDLPRDVDISGPLIFLILSSAVFSAACLMNAETSRVLNAAIFFSNASGMVFIASAVGYGATLMLTDKRVPYTQVFAIYAYATGITILAAWLPAFLWITEPWKWWLVGTGLTRGLQLTKRQAFSVVVMSIAVMTTGFWVVMHIQTL